MSEGALSAEQYADLARKVLAAERPLSPIGFADLQKSGTADEILRAYIVAWGEGVKAHQAIATERKVSEWLADECAALDAWADVNDRIGYQRTGDAPAWLEAARKAVSE